MKTVLNYFHLISITDSISNNDNIINYATQELMYCQTTILIANRKLDIESPIFVY